MPGHQGDRLPSWFRRGVLFVLLAVAGFQVAGWVFRELRGYLGLVALAWLISISFEPAVAVMHRRGMRRGLATATVMLSVLLFASVFAALFGAILIDQLRALVAALPGLVDDVIAWTNRTFETDLRAQDINDSLGFTPENTRDLAQNLASGLAGLISSFFSLVLQALALSLLVFYMSAQGPQMRRTIASWFLPRHQAMVVTAWDVITEKAGRYVMSKMILAVLSTLFTGVFLWLVDVPYWLPLALWTGLVSQFVPTVGTYIAIAVPALVALADQPNHGLWVVFFGVAYQQVENYVFAPRITSRTMSVHPAVGFSAAVAGVALFGPVGALFSVPVVAAIQALTETYGNRFELIESLREADDPSTGSRDLDPPADQNGPGAPMR